ncbi:MAG: DUF2306 domain-containing protein [Chloroflexota bacterium]
MKQLTRRQKIGWGLMAFFAIGIALFALGQYGGANPDNFFPQQRENYEANIVGLLIHIFGGAVALLLGPFLFLPATRQKKRLNWHRWLGRIYMISILFGGLSSFYIATFAHGGLPSTIGLMSLATLWLYTVGKAYTHIRNKDVQAHRRWMIRNYALTFSAVTLRLYLGLGTALVMTTGLFSATFTDVYITTTWISWVPNLIFAEWLINRQQRKQNGTRTSLAAAD